MASESELQWGDSFSVLQQCDGCVDGSCKAATSWLPIMPFDNRKYCVGFFRSSYLDLLFTVTVSTGIEISVYMCPFSCKNCFYTLTNSCEYVHSDDFFIKCYTFCCLEFSLRNKIKTHSYQCKRFVKEMKNCVWCTVKRACPEQFCWSLWLVGWVKMQCTDVFTVLTNCY